MENEQSWTQCGPTCHWRITVWALFCLARWADKLSEQCEIFSGEAGSFSGWHQSVALSSLSVGFLGGNFNYLSSGVSGIWQLKAAGLGVSLTDVLSSWPAMERPKATRVDEWQLHELLSPQCSKLVSSFWWVGFSLIIFSFVSKGDLIAWPATSNWYPSSFSHALLCNLASFCYS